MLFKTLFFNKQEIVLLKLNFPFLIQSKYVLNTPLSKQIIDGKLMTNARILMYLPSLFLFPYIPRNGN